MIISLLAPGDIEFHFYELLKFSRKRLESELEQLAEVLADSGVEIEFLPDKGLSLELAKKYKQKNGKRVIATLPQSDKEIGIKHLQEPLKTQVNNQPLFDEIIDTQNWYKHDILKALFGNSVLYLGSTFGTDLERTGSSYIFRIMQGNKKGVNTAGKFLHPQIQADENFKILVYSPFLITGKLPKEHEAYYKKFHIPLIYINSPEELKNELEK